MSRRELEVLNLVVEGHTTRQIAERLFVSPNTVKKHLAHVFAKCGVRSRVELATWWTLQRQTRLGEPTTLHTSSGTPPGTRPPRAKRMKAAAALLAGFTLAGLAVIVFFAQGQSATRTEQQAGALTTATAPGPAVVDGCRCPGDILIAVLQGPGAGALADCPPGCATVPPSEVPQ